jgi:hypothetical protein
VGNWGTNSSSSSDCHVLSYHLHSAVHLAQGSTSLLHAPAPGPQFSQTALLAVEASVTIDTNADITSCFACWLSFSCKQGAGPAPRSSRLAAARPTQPSMQILKVLLESEQPLTSHELQARVQQQYTHFPTRNSFKAYLKHLLRQKWVVAKAPAAKVSSTRSGHKKSQKGSDGHWLFSPTLVSWKLDLNSPGRPLQALALQEADVWTRQQLPAYADHMRQGRVPVTWQNLGVLTNAKQREEQYRKQLLAEGGQGAQQRRLGAGDEAAGSLQQLKQKKKQRR